MSDSRIVDVAELLDQQTLNRFHVLIISLCFLIFFVQGLDNTGITVAVSAILRAFNAQRSDMGITFGAAFSGFLLGSLVFGFFSDRYGRKLGTILGVLAYSVPCFATMFATTMHEITALRFLTGLGLGGVFPTTISLLNETAPKRFRVSFVTCAFIGFSCGNSATGLLGAWLIPPSGWQVMFFIGGAAGIVLSVILALWLPESIRFLTVKKPASKQLRRLISRAAPGLAITPKTVFILSQPPKVDFAPKQLFHGRLRLTTPLIWINFFAESIMYLTFITWLPTVIEGLGLQPQQALLAFSYATAGGIVAILVLARLLDRLGPPATMLSATGALIAIAFLGMPGNAPTLVICFAILAVACATGTHSSLIGTVGHFYPTRIRGKGVGFAVAVSRVASILGPVITGYLLSENLPIQEVLYLIAAPYIVVIVVSFLLGRLYTTSSDAALDEIPHPKLAAEGSEYLVSQSFRSSVGPMVDSSSKH